MKHVKTLEGKTCTA